nr:Phosphotransferase enzyme family [uncultured bacterium]
MFTRVVPDIAKTYGLDVRAIGNVQKGYRNESYKLTLADDKLVNLICFKREHGIVDRIARADAVSSHAAAAGLPVRIRYDERILKLQENSYAGIYEYLPGVTVAWEAYTKKHLKLLGWAMSDLHTALQTMGADSPHLLADELASLNARMRRYFSDDNVVRALREKLSITLSFDVFDTFEALIVHSGRLDGKQYVHMDMVRGNVLFGGADTSDRWQLDDIALTGIIDFEKTAYGLPVCDVARTLAFLLVDCPKTRSDILNYFLNSGYRKRGTAKLENRELIAPFVRFFLVHDFYKFLRHTPYESLENNHHYVRTRDILLEYGMISITDK